MNFKLQMTSTANPVKYSSHLDILKLMAVMVEAILIFRKHNNMAASGKRSKELQITSPPYCRNIEIISLTLIAAASEKGNQLP